MAAPEQSPPPATRNPGKRVVTFSCGLPTLIACIIGGIAGVTWVFFLGVLLGRGLTPESHIPKLERLMPRQTEPLPTPAPLRADPATPPARKAPISAEDLESRFSLKNQPADSRPASPAREPEKPREEKKSAPKEEQFDYVYQVASSRDASQAEALAARLKGAGIKARVAKISRNNATWHKVLVNFRGSPQGTRELRKDLARQGLPRLILDAKTPVR